MSSDEHETITITPEAEGGVPFLVVAEKARELRFGDIIVMTPDEAEFARRVLGVDLRAIPPGKDPRSA